MFTGDSCCSTTCSSPSSRTTVHSNNSNNMSTKRTIHVLDNELRLRSITNDINCKRSILNSSTFPIVQSNVGRFDELTHFFNIINGLFHQSAFTLGLSTYHLAPLFRLPELNIGMNIHLDQQSLEQNKIDLLKNMTIYSLISGNNNQQLNKLIGIIKFHTVDKNLMMSINHQWTPSFRTIFRFGTKPYKRLWSHIEYQNSNETYELIGTYGIQNSLNNIQFSYLSCLWQRMNYQIDGGIDFRITSKETLADIGFRLKYSSNSIVFKCDLYNPSEHFLIGIQNNITNNFTVGLLIETLARTYHLQSPIKFSFMSQWNLNKIGLRINTLVNTQKEFGLALTHQVHSFPLVLQTFGLYSWSIHKYKWGIGLQILF